HAAAFVAGTLAVDMQPLYQRFVPLFAKGAHLVDAGCGSGRDSLAFLQLGFEVTAFDASEQLAQLASHYIGQPVQICRFEQFNAQMPVDGIWACASLLHVAPTQLPAVMAHLAQQLKQDGYFYCSFKYGSGEMSRDGRTFTHLDESQLASLLADLPLTAVDVWQTADLRPGRADESWLNAILQKSHV
ncbi:MAG: class I SAM-dependent methyltransferase, partial [Aeromonas sp.]